MASMHPDRKVMTFSPERLEEPGIPLPLVVTCNQYVMLGCLFVAYH